MKIENLSYVYSEGTAFEKKALDQINLEIPDDQFIGIIGHTGSGKSTLIQHLNGLVKGTSGKIYYDGEDIYQDGFDMRSHVVLPVRGYRCRDSVVDIWFWAVNRRLSYIHSKGSKQI